MVMLPSFAVLIFLSLLNAVHNRHVIADFLDEEQFSTVQANGGPYTMSSGIVNLGVKLIKRLKKVPSRLVKGLLPDTDSEKSGEKVKQQPTVVVIQKGGIHNSPRRDYDYERDVPDVEDRQRPNDDDDRTDDNNEDGRRNDDDRNENSDKEDRTEAIKGKGKHDRNGKGSGPNKSDDRNENNEDMKERANGGPYTMSSGIVNLGVKLVKRLKEIPSRLVKGLLPDTDSEKSGEKEKPQTTVVVIQKGGIHNSPRRDNDYERDLMDVEDRQRPNDDDDRTDDNNEDGRRNDDDRNENSDSDNKADSSKAIKGKGKHDRNGKGSGPNKSDDKNENSEDMKEQDNAHNNSAEGERSDEAPARNEVAVGSKKTPSSYEDGGRYDDDRNENIDSINEEDKREAIKGKGKHDSTGKESSPNKANDRNENNSGGIIEDDNKHNNSGKDASSMKLFREIK